MKYLEILNLFSFCNYIYSKALTEAMILINSDKTILSEPCTYMGRVDLLTIIELPHLSGKRSAPDKTGISGVAAFSPFTIHPGAVISGRFQSSLHAAKTRETVIGAASIRPGPARRRHSPDSRGRRERTEVRPS